MSTGIVQSASPYADQPKTIADVYAFRSEADPAFAWLERAYEKHDPELVYLKPDPFLKSLQGDPRWETLLRRIGLSAE